MGSVVLSANSMEGNLGTGGSEDPEMCRQRIGVQGESVGQRTLPMLSTEPDVMGVQKDTSLARVAWD